MALSTTTSSTLASTTDEASSSPLVTVTVDPECVQPVKDFLQQFDSAMEPYTVLTINIKAHFAPSESTCYFDFLEHSVLSADQGGGTEDDETLDKGVLATSSPSGFIPSLNKLGSCTGINNNNDVASYTTYERAYMYQYTKSSL